MAFVDLKKAFDQVPWKVIGAEKTRCEGVDCATGAGNVCQCMEQCVC